MDITKEFIGLGELEACLQNKDFSSCATLAGEVLVGAKAKALKNAYDALKLLKRGCKIAGATAKALQTAAAGKGCLEGKTNCDVLDPETGNKITDIDLFENDVLWEDKHVLGYWADED